MIAAIKAYAADILAALLIVAVAAWGVQTWRLHSAQTARDAAVSKYDTLAGQVKQQNAQAAARLAELTAARDARQSELDALYAQQEKTDAQAKSTIADLQHQLSSQPIRVRYITSNTGDSGGSTASQNTGSAGTGARDGAEAVGVLPDANSRRIVELATEAETINAAYASCRKALLAVADQSLRINP